MALECPANRQTQPQSMPVFKTGRAWQPHAWMVRSHRRSVEGKRCTGASFWLGPLKAGFDRLLAQKAPRPAGAAHSSGAWRSADVRYGNRAGVALCLLAQALEVAERPVGDPG